MAAMEEPRTDLSHKPRGARAFTLVELLVVVAIIAVIAALVLSALSVITGRAREAKSMSNLRQWGIGYVSFAHDNAGKLPWEGLKEANQIATNMSQKTWWGNAIPPYVSQSPYSAFSDAAVPSGGDGIPLPPDDKSIFVDPAAELPDPLPGESTFTGWIGGTKRFYFDYVPNAELNNHLDISSIGEIDRRVRLSALGQPGVTVLMMEMRSVARELDTTGYSDPTQHPFWNEALNRQMGDWQRFAARHRGGGHMMFGDGHVEWRSNRSACTTANGVFANDNSLDHNQRDLIWDPLGPTNEQP
jgi:hypothetical protein